MIRVKTIHIIIQTVLAGLLVFLCTLGVFARDVAVSASVDRTTVGLGEEFQYTLTIQNASPEGSPRLPPFDGFTILSGPNTSQSIQFINGQMSSEHTYTVSLRADRPGNFTIKPATVRVNGREIKSEAITINVVKTTARNVPAPLKGESIPVPSSTNAQLNKYLRGKLFLRTRVDNKTPFVGEPVVVTYTLYARKGLPLVSWNLRQPLPQFKESLKEDLYTAQRLSFRDVKIGTDTYQAALVKKIILVPTKTGKLLLDPITLEMGVRVQNQRRRRHPFFNDPFFDDSFFNDSFFSPFGGNVVRVSVPSSVLELNVQPLLSPRPADFTGTVGDYVLSAKLDRKKATMDDLLTLSLTFSGTGAVEGILTPKLPPLEGFEVYETKAKANKKITADVLGGSKTFDCVLRPKKPGALQIPEIHYSIFNPKKKIYVALKTKPITIPIAPGTAKAPLIMAGNVPVGSSENVIEINADINYIKRGAVFSRRHQHPLILTGWFMGIQALPVLFLLGAFVFKRRREALESDVGLARRLRARGVAGRRLKAAERAMSNNNADQFYAELTSALRGFFGDKLNREPHGLTLEELLSLLEERGASPEELESIRQLLEAADAARYAPFSILPEDMRKHYEMASNLIQGFSKKL